MPDLKALVAELESSKKAAESILEQHKNGLTAEKAAEVDRLIARAGELQEQITDERRAGERKAALERSTEFLERPEYRVPRGIEPGHSNVPENKRMLLEAGWEFKSGIVYAPTSVKGADGQNLYPMFGEDVLFGDLPTDNPEQRKFFEMTRAAFQPLYRKTYEKLIRMSARMPAGLSPITLMSDAEQKALTEGMDTAGGFLVPPDIQAEVLAKTAQIAVFRGNARVQTTSRDILKWPMVQGAAATAGGLASGAGVIFSSGFVGSWVGEVPTATDTDPAFGEFDVPIKKLRVATRLSNDFVSDSATNVLAFLAQNGAENMALVEDNGFFNGIGGVQPMGVLVSGSLAAGTDVEGSTSNTISNTTSNAGSAPKIVDLCYALSAQYLNGASWYMRRSIEGKVRKLVDFQARFLWPAMAGSAFAAAPRELLGYPLYNSDFMPADGTDTNKVFLFGNLANGYIIGQRAQISSVILRERYADTDQTGIILFERVGGDVWNGDALKVGIV